MTGAVTAAAARMAVTLFDAHCHLQDTRISHCLPQLLHSASTSGVRWFAVNGTCEEDWEPVKKLAESYPSVIPNFGLHPWYVGSRSAEWLSSLKCILSSVPAAAVGEAGLDMGVRGRAVDEDTQVLVLKQQLELARELHRPISLHCVRAFGLMQDVLQEMGDFPDGIILHSYMGSGEMVKALLRHGCYFSFSGFVTALKKQKAQRLLAEVPMERILIETDAPDALPKLEEVKLASVPGSDVPDLNHPSNIRSVLSWVASMKGVSEEELSAATFDNAKRLFSYPGSKLLA